MLHTIVVQVEDKPGVLNRVASLFRRRAYNIESLTVRPRRDAESLAHDNRPRTPTRAGPDGSRPNLYKLVNVIRVEDLTSAPAVYRDLALIKVAATADTRTHVDAAHRRVSCARHRRRT